MYRIFVSYLFVFDFFSVLSLNVRFFPVFLDLFYFFFLPKVKLCLFFFRALHF